jgi:hypothetical protein
MNKQQTITMGIKCVALEMNTICSMAPVSTLSKKNKMIASESISSRVFNLAFKSFE